MTPIDALNKLKEQIPEGTNLLTALDKFISFYKTTNIDGCNKNSDGDMLLFQWGGPYSWDKSFSINLTRQFSYEDDEGEYEGMQQLQMNCRYNPEDIKIESGNEWYDGVNVDIFSKEVLGSEAVKAASKLQIQSLNFELGNV